MSRIINVCLVLLFFGIAFVIFADTSIMKVETIFHQIYVAIHYLAILILFVSGCLIMCVDSVMAKLNNIDEKLNSKIASKSDVYNIVDSIKTISEPKELIQEVKQKTVEAQVKHKYTPCPICQQLILTTAILDGLRQCPKCLNTFDIEG